MREDDAPRSIDPNGGGWSRRGLIVRAAAMAGAALTPAAASPGLVRTRLKSDPFTLGVASGEPAPDGAVIWTRLAPRPLDPDGGMPAEPVVVGWEVGEDTAFSRIAARGRTLALPERGHAVHVELAGLEPDRDYWYRFFAGGAQSPIGRTRTTPAPGAMAQRLRLAFGSCQKYEAGFYAAHAQIAADAPDLVVFLGDYIYEGAASSGGVRRHPGAEAKDLAGYRIRYGCYKSDPDLQAAHAAAPWVTIWDDHEVANDYGGGGEDLARRAAAYQAYFEHMPLRRRCQPVGPQMLLHRTLDWGRLAQFQLVDTRQYRSGAACSTGPLIHDCAGRGAVGRTLLGGAQERWLFDRLGESRAQWNLLAQQYVMGEVRLPGSWFLADGWDGCPAGRRRILERWRDAKTPNPIALGGDIHTFVAGDLTLERGGPVIGSEFVGGSISSKPHDLGLARLITSGNPHLRWVESRHRGYGLIELDERVCTVAFRGVADARLAGSPVRNLARFVVEDGRAGVQRA